MLELAIKFLLSYFLGSVMGSLVMGRIRGGVDIRTMGSGNAGGTNALRTQGWAFALGVMVIDIGKGVIGTGVVPGIELPMVGISPDVSREWLTLCCAAASVIGHVWPMWHQFRGGKGAATLVGTLVVLAPFLLLPIVAAWAVVLVLSGYVGLSTMVAGFVAPVVLALVRLPEDQPVFIYCAAMSMYLVFSHRSNIRRMLEGSETRTRGAMIFHRRRA
ncbi:MAG: glycerol-3-phosphate 1-O-acyltransferase PlsY [Proteobacteria bacterium]|nr:glycerol-3-phosphate 1-O-acyltransferase PlsY [Pseudomonadota bacterium]MDA0994306.1 glycerol-3-phosphate 1-O-acyltransferase PlsY [Pseudomonadota bacterium]